MPTEPVETEDLLAEDAIASDEESQLGEDIEQADDTSSGQVSGDESEDDGGSLSPDELQKRWLEARRGLSRKGQEVSALQKRMAALEEQNTQLLIGMRDPKFVATLHDHFSKVSSSEPETPAFSKLAEETGFEEATLQGLAKALDRLGYVKKTDPELSQAKQALSGLLQEKAVTTWKGLVDKFPDAQEHRDAIVQIAQRVGDAMSLEQIYHGVTNGSGAEAKAREVQKAKVAQKKQASLPQSHARGGTTAKPKQYESIHDAFEAAAKELGLDPGNLGRLRR